MANDFAEITKDFWEAHASCAHFRHAVVQRGISSLSESHFPPYCGNPLIVNPLYGLSLPSTLNSSPVPFSKWKSYFLLALSNVQNTASTIS